jgi:hypothetical protein
MRWDDSKSHWVARPVVEPNDLVCLVCGEGPSVFRGKELKKKREALADAIVKEVAGNSNVKIAIACSSSKSAMSLLKVVKRKLKLKREMRNE